MSEQLRIGPRETLEVKEDTSELLEVEATYEPGNDPPPKHHHPAQDERFEVLEGSMRAVVGGEERVLLKGDELEIPRKTAHRMWNDGETPARVRWQTRPGLRTLQWFRALDEIQRTGKTTGAGAPKPTAVAPLLFKYRDVFRLSL